MRIIKKILVTALETIKKFLIELWTNAPAAFILFLSACGLCTLLPYKYISSIALLIPFIDTSALLIVISVGIIYTIVSIIPSWEKACFQA